MIKTIAPLSKTLSKYIAYYYIFINEEPTMLSYVAFPHVNTCISLFKGVEIQREDLSLRMFSNEDFKDKVSIEITGKYTQPFFVNYLGDFDEIAIIFKPLGVNYFLKDDLIEHAPAFSQALPLPHWHALAEKLFLETNLNNRIELLESFLLDNFSTIDDAIIRKAMLLLEDFEKDYSVQEVADLCGLTIKSLQRNFKKLLTCTPSEYKRILKFRHSLGKDALQGEIKKLTEIALESNYYDQSYFIREYKKLTGKSPKAFFTRISKLEGDKIIWEVK
ncbi:helix-turn-helix domain-containing protein [Mongoliitalea daihaiensis]|uniref:helix-turn-helix domain-containing protein n=1 Tax=Mongoliitalea daihaiensis TaxID=2782006 RepID=UPI001F23D000|nr:AraC family transcriptional regulator [Mongoliitalea daihaiensis]UJP66390.1 helix-turn-helix transcriptional regulator [Mongoliitalea daihaiensis]